ncbi:MAG: hypothetical protein IK118_05325 [Clostridia bacterium]|nr:hypothetical protein [Clostridia bacterium]
MASELEKMLAFADSYVGSSVWHGRCQGFVARCYYAGTGRLVSRASAKQARIDFMRSGTAGDLCPPAGAAVYFNGDGSMGRLYGHVALSAGGGWMYDPVGTIVKRKLSAGMHNGYLGWGWNGNIIPGGASDSAGGGDTGGGSAGERSAGTIVSVRTVSVGSRAAFRADDTALKNLNTDGLSVLIGRDADAIAPCVVGVPKLTSFAGISPAVLEFTVVGIDDGGIGDGDAVSFSFGGKNMFFGYVFTVERRHDGQVCVKCFDQLRYLKNRDSFVFGGKASELVKLIAAKYGLRTGTIVDTGCVLPQTVYENTLADIFSEALTATLEQTGRRFLLYDDAGALTLKNADSGDDGVMLDPGNMSSYVKRYSIDDGVYNRVAAASDDRRSGVRSLYIANDPAAEKRWGVLQYYKRIDASQEPAETVKKLLNAYSRENICVIARGCAGSSDVRGGSVVKFSEDGERYADMRCESVEHTFSGGVHLMDVKMRYITRETL